MADEELAPEGGEALELTPEAGGGDAPQETPEPIVNLATELGWVPKDQFRGEPDKWKPAEQFIRDGRDIQQTTARELRSLREQMDRMGQVTETIAQDRVAAARAEWQRQYDEAFDSGDKETAKALLNDIPTVKPAAARPDTTVQQWVAKNTWYNEDPLAQARAVELSERLAHLPVPEQLSQVERAIRKEFPEHFPKAKDPPGVQTGTSRNPSPSNRAKGFADMPQASQSMARDMVKRHPALTLEAVAKSYWADPTNQKGA